ncbi:WD40 repeat-like protein [Gautieria morchelliformis]|nr:WD40 repeat-like protein [Gautieria morchelliformis]
MRTRHTSHTLPAFPVYSSAFLANDLLVLGGGGGSGKSGIKNRIRLYRIENDEKMEMLDELQLGDEDAPMSMAVCLNEKELACGINSTIDELQKGKNENCRIYSVVAQKIGLTRKCGTFQSDNAEDYQNVTAISSDQSLLAVGSTKNEVMLRWYTSLTPAALSIQLQRGQLYDATFSPASLIIAATTHLEVYSLPKARSGKKKKLDALSLLRIVDPPTSPAQGLTFRAARFHPIQPETMYTVLNASPPRVRGKPSPRPAYICMWDTNTWQMIKMRKVAEKGVTCFDVSADGKLVAFGSSDYTIGVLDSQTLAPVLTILRAHDFPPTTLRFSPDASLLISGSADNTLRIIVVPKNFESSWTTIMIIMMTLLVLMLAIALKQGMIF